MRAFTKVILWRDEFTVDQAAERNPRSGQRAADAPLSVRDADVAFSSVYINQQLAPNDFMTADDGDPNWGILGSTYNITGATLLFQLVESPG